MKKKLLIALTGAALVVAGFTINMPSASAWHGLTMHGSAQCYNGAQRAGVTAENVERQTATVRQSTGPVFNVNDAVAAYSTKAESFTKPAGFVGDVTVAIKVNYPDDGTLRPSSVTIHFKGDCEPPSTTTTTQPTPPTTNPPPVDTVPRETTTTTEPHSTTTEPPDGCGGEGQPACAVPVTPKFTG